MTEEKQTNHSSTHSNNTPILGTIPSKLEKIGQSKDKKDDQQRHPDRPERRRWGSGQYRQRRNISSKDRERTERRKADVGAGADRDG